MPNKKDDAGRIEKGLQPIVRPMTVQPSQGEQAGLQPIARPRPAPEGSGAGDSGGSGGGSGSSGGSGKTGE